ncbi:hypothetical protein EDD17DRAFT_1426678, partial [Pisolithus thermaeus]
QRMTVSFTLKITGGVDLTTTASSPQTIQQTQLSSTFTNRIAIAFLGAAYAFLDGLVHLTSSDLPV